MSSPGRLLAVDVGTGTQDILIAEPGQPLENALQLVMPSPHGDMMLSGCFDLLQAMAAHLPEFAADIAVVLAPG